MTMLGAPSESYLDDDNRWMFHNAAEAAPASVESGRYCARRVEDGYELEQVRARLAPARTKRRRAASARA